MRICLILLTTIFLLSSCRKQDQLEDQEGKIVNAWDGSGIPGAALHLLDFVPSNSWLSGGYDILDSIHTDENGIFVLPRSPHYDALGADHVQYHRIGEPFRYASSTLGLINITLIPRAWIQFSAEDTGNPNQEVTKIEIESQDHPYVGDHSILNNPSDVRSVLSSVGSGQFFVKIFTGNEFELSIVDFDLIHNDTLQVVVEY
jgi:hypothetical protein